MSAAFVTANGVSVYRGSIERPRFGAWRADLMIDAGPEELSTFQGSVDLRIGEHSFRGYAYRVGTFKGAISVRLVGGAGGLGKELGPKAYLNVPLRIPLTDILQGAGEQLSAQADGSVLSRNLSKWVRMTQPAGFALAALLVAAGNPTWRVLDDGSIWVGPEVWTESRLELVDITNQDPSTGRVELATDTPWLLVPGTTYDGRRVSYVEHRIEGGSLRHVLWLEDETRVG